MNEQLIKIGLESGMLNYVDNETPRHYFLSGHADEQDLAKFAEAIIRECCIALNPMLRDMISRGQGVDMIKLHFGMNPKEITTRMLDTAIDQMEKQLAEKKHDS